jgi:hypothetical protein
MDVDGIPFGVNFVKALHEEVAKCGVLLAVIGPDWLKVRDKDGNRRLDNPNDFVRVEIAAALQREIPVIPILLEGTPVPNADQLPKDLQELSLRNGINVHHASFHNDMDRLIQGLRGESRRADWRATAASSASKTGSSTSRATNNTINYVMACFISAGIFIAIGMLAFWGTNYIALPEAVVWRPYLVGGMFGALGAVFSILARLEATILQSREESWMSAIRIVFGVISAIALLLFADTFISAIALFGRLFGSSKQITEPIDSGTWTLWSLVAAVLGFVGGFGERIMPTRWYFTHQPPDFTDQPPTPPPTSRHPRPPRVEKG